MFGNDASLPAAARSERRRICGPADILAQPHNYNT